MWCAGGVAAFTAFVGILDLVSGVPAFSKVIANLENPKFVHYISGLLFALLITYVCVWPFDEEDETILKSNTFLFKIVLIFIVVAASLLLFAKSFFILLSNAVS